MYRQPDIDVAKDEEAEPVLVLSSGKETVEIPAVETMDMRSETFSQQRQKAVQLRTGRFSAMSCPSPKQEKSATKVVSEEEEQVLVLTSAMKIIETPVLETKIHEPSGQVGTADRVEEVMAPAVVTKAESIEDSIEMTSPVLGNDGSTVAKEVDIESASVLAMGTADESVEKIGAVDFAGGTLFDSTVSDTKVKENVMIKTIEEKPIVEVAFSFEKC